MYILKTEWYLELYIAHCIYIFKRNNNYRFFLNVCIYPGLKYETLNFALQLRLYFLSRLFLHNWCVLNSNLSDKIIYLVSFTFKKAKQKMATKTTFFLYLCYKLLHDFWFLRDFEFISLSLMFFDQNDLYLTFKFKIVTANRQIKVFFMHVNYNIKI